MRYALNASKEDRPTQTAPKRSENAPEGTDGWEGPNAYDGRGHGYDRPTDNYDGPTNAYDSSRDGTTAHKLRAARDPHESRGSPFSLIV